MRKSRIYTTIIAIGGGLIFAFLLVQIQHNPSFLLGDVLRLNLPENFVGVHYALQEDVLVVGSEGLSQDTQVSVSISYNPDRVSVDMSTFTSLQETVSVVDDGSLVSVVIRIVDLNADLFSMGFMSDEEYHIVVSEASILRNDIVEPVAIQRLY